MTTAFPDCAECGTTGLGRQAMEDHRWRRHTAGIYLETFGRSMLAADAVRWHELRRAEREKAVEQRRRTLDVVKAW